MTSSIARFVPRLSKKATKLRTQDCQKFDIRSSNPLDDADKRVMEEIQQSTGWEKIAFRVEGNDHIAEFRMASTDKADPKTLQSVTTYI